MTDLFSDTALLARALQFEAALGRACAAAGVIDSSHGELIAREIHKMNLPTHPLVEAVHQAGTLAIPVVAAVRQAVGLKSDKAAEAVHLGSTSQDMADTVMVMQCHAATQQLCSLGWRVCDRLADLAEAHVATPTVGRTLMRRAMPTTFGLRVTRWLSPLVDALKRVVADCQRLEIQLGGAVGTRAGLKGKSARVLQHLSAELGIPGAADAWHTNRTNTAALAASLALVGAALSKLAQDTALLGQDELGELSEGERPGRGGSSAMAGKRNPIDAQQCLLAARRLPGLLQGMYSIAAQENERSLAGWQLELPMLAEMFIWTYDALQHARALVDDLQVHPDAMLRNLNATADGLDLGEARALALQTIAEYRSTR